MTMTAHVAVDGTNETNGTLAAFAGAEIRGLQSSSSVLPFGPYTGQSIYSITLYGDSNGVALTFKWSPNGTEENSVSLDKNDSAAINYTINGTLGSALSPTFLVGTSPTVYETTPTLIVDVHPTTNTGIPEAATGDDWYQSFTAENSAKLTKFAFVTNGSFSATADVKIREGEGITGNILHSGTWTGIGSNTNAFNEYVIDNEVLLTSGLQYTIQLENQTSGGFIGSSTNRYDGGLFYRTGYGVYGDLKMKIWALLEATGNAIAITSPSSNDQNITNSNDNLSVAVNYQSSGGGYQTPKWTYRIDSGFPGYGSPHGGTQVTGNQANDFLVGQPYGTRQVNVALLDSAGNLHNPPVTQSISVNYQTPTSGYQSSTGGTIAISSPSNSADVNATNDNLQVTVTYTSPSGGYQTPTWAYRIDSGFPGYGSPHGGTQVTGNQANDFLNGLAYGTRQVNVALLDPAGNLHNPPVTQSISVNYQTPTSGYQSSTGGTIAISSPSNSADVNATNDNLQVTVTYTSPSGGYQTPTWAYRIDSGFPGYGSPHGGTQVSGNQANDFLAGESFGARQVNVALLDSAGNLHNPPVTQSISVNYQTPTSGYQSGGGGYQSSTGGTIAISSPSNSTDVNATNDNLQVSVTYTSPSGGYQTPTWAYRIDSGFPGYGSPHGGTQVTGNQANDFLAGESFGARQVNVALLDSAGNLHNPPVTQSISVNYQTSTSGYQSGGGGYQSSTGGTITISSPSNSADVNATNDNLQVSVTYTSPSGGYQTPTWAYRIDSGFPGYGSPHGGTQVTGNQANDFLAGESFGARQVNVALLDSAGNLHNPPVTQSISVNYQTPTSGYQSDSGNYQSSGGDYQSSGSGWSINPGTYQNSMSMTAFVSVDGSSKGSGSLAAFAGSQIRGLQSNLSFPTFGPHQGQGLFQIMIYGEIDATPLQFKWSADGTEANAISVSRQDGISISFENNGNQGSVISPVSLLGTSQPGNSYQSDSGNYQSSGGDYQSDSDGYQSPDSDYQDPAGEQAEENTPFTVTASKLTNGQITFTSNAPVDSLYSVEIQLTNLSNLSPSKEGKLIFNLDGKGSTTLMTLDQVEEDGGWGYNWSYWWNYGYSGESQNSNYAYRIPLCVRGKVYGRPRLHGNMEPSGYLCNRLVDAGGNYTIRSTGRKGNNGERRFE